MFHSLQFALLIILLRVISSEDRNIFLVGIAGILVTLCTTCIFIEWVEVVGELERLRAQQTVDLARLAQLN